ncbi:hypothetical protein [Falsirhodobacter xinxiangensis]|uniref:hypothetical protein n=1 Tax=Falsirhodobacter xinxiangensis TaxID=2530049 RepID=UPI0010AAD6DA|nr:hypothetical protein [Rhodobacter xinxiangensis]
MRKPLLAALALTMTLGACGRLNPANWGGGRPEPVDPAFAPVVATVDPRPLVAQVTSLRVEQTRDGAIVRATGLPPTQGYWQAELIARPLAEGVQVYDFRIVPPAPGQRVSTQASREVTVAAGLSRSDLAGIRQIVVQGAGNSLSSVR